MRKVVTALVVGALLAAGPVLAQAKGGKGVGYEIKLGTSNVIKGWHEGITGMKVGERRKLTIPPNLAYGNLGKDGVNPPNSTLVFDIELLKIQ